MKFVQYVNEDGVNAYIPADRIVRITDEGPDKSMILLSHDVEGLSVKMKPLDLIHKLNEDGPNIIITEHIYTESSASMLQQAMKRSIFGSMSTQNSDEEDSQV